MTAPDTAPTPWTRVEVVAEGRHAEPIADLLFALGALSVDTADADADTPDETPLFGEPGAPPVQAWRRARVAALFDSATASDVERDRRREVADALADAGLTADTIRVDSVAEQDWVRLTQQQFAPIAIGGRLWIVPTWCDLPPQPDAIALRLDPGLAFGTGSHPTTQLCLRWLEAQLRRGESVLDYGCGSGILAIAAARLGAGDVTGLDIDPQALVATRANAALNEVTVTVLGADAPEVPVCDVVLANILANPLRALAPLLAGLTRPAGGRLVLSGLLATQVDEIAACYASWIDFAPAQTEDGWACLSGTRRPEAGPT
jgi:ribosomal protein L11 methyltransferase